MLEVNQQSSPGHRDADRRDDRECLGDQRSAATANRSTQVGGVMDSTTIQTMPLISRNPVALTLLTAGVTNPRSHQIE